MIRYVVCSAALLGVVLAVKSGLHAALSAYGFWPYMAICAVSVALMVLGAFAWDRREARHSPEVLPPLNPVYPPYGPKQRYPGAN